MSALSGTNWEALRERIALAIAQSDVNLGNADAGYAVDSIETIRRDPAWDDYLVNAEAVLALFTLSERVNDDGWASSTVGPDGVHSHTGRPSSRTAVLTERATS